MSYRLDYSANHPEQIVQDGASVAAPAIRYVEVPRRGFTFPSILKTTAVFLTGAAALFTWETAAPEGYRIRSEEHTSELQSLMRTSYAVFCLKKKKYKQYIQ